MCKAQKEYVTTHLHFSMPFAGYHVAEGCAVYHVCAASTSARGVHRQSFLCPANETFDSTKLQCLPRE